MILLFILTNWHIHYSCEIRFIKVFYNLTVSYSSFTRRPPRVTAPFKTIKFLKVQYFQVENPSGHIYVYKRFVYTCVHIYIYMFAQAIF